jgi:hypothetical protein
LPDGPPHLALLVNLPSLNTPEAAREFSSHRLVWEAIAQHLTANPFAVGQDVNAYLDAQLRKLSIAPHAVDRLAFIDRLILPAYALGLAGVLVEAQVPLRIYGQGWDKTACRDHARGPVETRAAFESIVDSAMALVRPWPVTFVHEIDALGCPVLKAAMTRVDLLASARVALEGNAPVPSPVEPTLRAEHVLAAL